MMMIGFSFNLWAPLLLYPTAGPLGAPRWKIGWPASLVFYAVLSGAFIAAVMLHRREWVAETCMKQLYLLKVEY